MVIHGDCRTELTALPAESFDSVVTDPPYGLEFMGKEWDSPKALWRKDVSHDKTGRGSWFGDNGIAPRYGKDGAAMQAFHQEWAAAVLRVLKPGGYMLAMGGSRTYHRLACAVEDAGFEIRDCLMWLYGTGFPKGQGCLKPAYEPILLARKPGKRVLPLQIDACRVPGQWRDPNPRQNGHAEGYRLHKRQEPCEMSPAGRYPANVLHDGSEEVLEAFAAFGESSGRASPRDTTPAGEQGGVYGLSKYANRHKSGEHYGDTGTAARFFYCAKASKSERGEGNSHPTVKPLALMRYLVRLVTPPGGKVLDPFAGSGTTLLAAELEGREAVGIEQDAKHCEIIRARLAQNLDAGLFNTPEVPESCDS